ncbi:putative uncharacterized protein YHR217C [Arachis duranensis]|uniref:Uncharacterized protein n=1 Tax=Arachis duranensis TaxID=130453 RepID=A0A6P4DXB0_ARADU|nr:putative uncharacterized protein YHR217C [Arachis duranensis]
MGITLMRDAYCVVAHLTTPDLHLLPLLSTNCRRSSSTAHHRGRPFSRPHHHPTSFLFLSHHHPFSLSPSHSPRPKPHHRDRPSAASVIPPATVSLFFPPFTFSYHYPLSPSPNLPSVPLSSDHPAVTHLSGH